MLPVFVTVIPDQHVAIHHYLTQFVIFFRIRVVQLVIADNFGVQMNLDLQLAVQQISVDDEFVVFADTCVAITPVADPDMRHDIAPTLVLLYRDLCLMCYDNGDRCFVQFS